METDTDEVERQWTFEEIVAILCNNPDMLKQNFSKYWSSIQKYYESSAPPLKGLPKLSPHDLHLQWRFESYKDKELSMAVMNVAPSVVSVSVFSGVRRYLDCSGFVIDWDQSNGKATILTYAKIMRFPGKRDDYYIAVRLANGKILLAEEDYVDYYNNIATLKVNSDATLKPVDRDLSPIETVEGVVAALGREFYTCKLSESSGLIRKDYPYFGCELLVSSTCSGGEILEGGPLFTRKGHVCGINFFDGSRFLHPLPSSVIFSCLNMWDSNGIVMRPWFGLTVIDIAQLPHDALETIAGVSGDSTAVVKEVYEGSPADKVGVHPGDKITSLCRSGKRIEIVSASQYAQVLSSISGELSACCPDKTPDILISVHGYDSHICKVVHAENLRVDDKRFCRSWVGDESDGTDWYLEPQFGSQMNMANEIHNADENGINTNVLERIGSETGTSYDNEMGDDVSMYSEC